MLITGPWFHLLAVSVVLMFALNWALLGIGRKLTYDGISGL